MHIIKNLIQASIDTKIKLLADEAILSGIAKSVEIITQAFKNGNKLLLCGNGGSAADAQHLAAEFTGRFYKDRDALPAEALHVNTSYLTAVGNDYGYEYVYSRILKGIGKPGDVLIGISTSGNSGNIINAINQAKTNGMHCIGFTGNGGKMQELCSPNISIPSNDTPRIQECHILVGHIICQLVEENLF